MTHREVLEALSGLLLAMLVAILSSTIVSAALPRIITDLEGSQSSFTWVVTATLLALTVSTPIWGKLADLLDRKLLVQLALVIFAAGSVAAGFAQSTSWLIGCRVVQGLGIGGLTALVQVVLSDLVSPRERGPLHGPARRRDGRRDRRRPTDRRRDHRLAARLDQAGVLVEQPTRSASS